MVRTAVDDCYRDGEGEEVLDAGRPPDCDQPDDHDDRSEDAHDEVLHEQADHVVPTGDSAARISRSASAASVTVVLVELVA